LVAEREKWLRIKAGISADATVDLALVKLPADALMFPAPPARGEKLSFAKLRDPRAVTRTFKRRARKLGFPGLRLHDLRGSHETILLDASVPLKRVADRCGHDAATLWRNYAKRSKKGDTSAADVIGKLTAGLVVSK